MKLVSVLQKQISWFGSEGIDYSLEKHSQLGIKNASLRLQFLSEVGTS